MNIIEKIEQEMAAKNTHVFEIGDDVEVHYQIVEGEKERIQIFKGTVIARKGTKAKESMTVRKVVQGEGVERTFPLTSPRLKKIEIKRSAKVRRAKLYFLRDRVGKATRLKNRSMR